MTTDFRALPLEQRVTMYRAYSVAAVNDVSSMTDEELSALSWAFYNDDELREELDSTNMYNAMEVIWDSVRDQGDLGAVKILGDPELQVEGLFIPALTLGVLAAAYGGAAAIGAAVPGATAVGAMSALTTGATAPATAALMNKPVLLIASAITSISPSALYHSTVARGTIVSTFLVGATGIAAGTVNEMFFEEEQRDAEAAGTREAELDELDYMAEAAASRDAMVGASQQVRNPAGSNIQDWLDPNSTAITDARNREAGDSRYAGDDRNLTRSTPDPMARPGRSPSPPVPGETGTPAGGPPDPQSPANQRDEYNDPYDIVREDERYTTFTGNPYQRGSLPPIMPPKGANPMEGMDNPFIGVPTPHKDEYGNEIPGYVAWRQGTMQGRGDSGLERYQNQGGYWQVPRYREQDYLLLQSTLTEAAITKFQDQMVRAGYMSEDSITGLLDIKTSQALERILGESNVSGVNWLAWSNKVAIAGDEWNASQEAKDAKNEKADRIKRRLEALGPFQRNVYLEPDYATLAETAKGAIERELGRKVNDWEMQFLTDTQESDYRDKFNVDEGVRSQNYNSQVRAIEQDLQAGETFGGGTAQDVDPAAQFKQTFDQKFEKELDRKETTLGAGERSDRLMSGLNNAMSAIGGRN